MNFDVTSPVYVSLSLLSAFGSAQQQLLGGVLLVFVLLRWTSRW